jgi:multidrug efflux pump subunit AcrB
MERIIRIFTDNWRFAFLITAVILIFGVLTLPVIRREILPPVNFAKVTIQTVYPGASPEEVQDKVTAVIEEELRGVSGIKDVSSFSQNDLSEITVRIDIDSGRSDLIVNEINRAVQRASSQLPPELTQGPSILAQKAKEIPILEIAVTGGALGACRVRDGLSERLEETLDEVSGVSRVRLTGNSERQFQVILRSSDLARLDIGYSDVLRVLSSHLINVPAGNITDGKSIQLVRVMGKTKSVEDIGNIVIRANDAGNAVRIKNVAKVIDCGSTPHVRVRYNGKDATMLTITKKEDADAIEVIQRLRTALDNFRKTAPDSFQISIYRDAGKDIDTRLGIVTFNAVAGFIVVLMVLFIFLPGRVGLMSAISLPVSTMGTIAMMVVLGADFNVITMVSLVICLGNLVDNSVVVSEYYIRLREKGINGSEAAVASAKQFWVPFTASTVTIVAAFLPMLVTKGVLGEFIKWIPVVVTIALCLSLFEALLLLPARLRFFDVAPAKKNMQTRGQKVFSRVEQRFEKLIGLTLRHRMTTFGIIAALLFGSIGITVAFNRFELFPAEGVEYYTARFSAAPGTGIAVTDEIGTKIAQSMSDKLGRSNIVSTLVYSGLQQTGFGDTLAKRGEHVGLVTVRIKEELTSQWNANETVKKLQTVTRPSGCTELSFISQQNGPPVGKALTVTLRGSDPEKLDRAVDALVAQIREVKGIRNTETNVEAAGREYRLTLNELMAARAQTSVDQIGRQLRTALEGLTIARINVDGKERDVVVKSSDSEKTGIQKLSRMETQTQSGSLVPLDRVATFTEGEAPKARRNYNFKKAVTITADVDAAVITSASANREARKIFDVIKKGDSSISAAFGGEEEATRDSIYSLSLALLIAVIAIFTTLVFTFRSFRTPILILSTIPLGLVGVMAAFTVTQTPLGFMSFVGIVGLSGVVINSAIVLVDYIETLRTAKPKLPVEQIVIIASRERFRAVLATGLTTVIGLLPTAIGLGGYDSILVPITLALSWGILVGTLLTLVWIPSGYVMLYGTAKKK